MSAAAVLMYDTHPAADPPHPPRFPSSDGFEELGYTAYRRAAIEQAVAFAMRILERTPIASEEHAFVYALSEAEASLGRRLDTSETILAQYAMRQAWSLRRAPLALVPDPVAAGEEPLEPCRHCDATGTVPTSGACCGACGGAGAVARELDREALAAAESADWSDLVREIL